MYGIEQSSSSYILAVCASLCPDFGFEDDFSGCAYSASGAFRVSTLSIPLAPLSMMELFSLCMSSIVEIMLVVIHLAITNTVYYTDRKTEQ